VLSAVMHIVENVVDRLVDRIPDPNERARAKEEYERMLLKAVAEAGRVQAEINKVEAAHKSLFVAGWRPFIGWICGLSLMWAFVGYPIAVWALNLMGCYEVEVPKIETDVLFQLVLAMLGMGGLRTFEKIRGVAREK